MPQVPLLNSVSNKIESTIKKAQNNIKPQKAEWGILSLNDVEFDVHVDSNIKDLVTIYYQKKEIAMLKDSGNWQPTHWAFINEAE